MTEQDLLGPATCAPDPYAAAWSDLRQRRYRLLLSLVALSIAVALPRVAAVDLGPTALLIAIATTALCIHYDRFRCPRCTQLFCRMALYCRGFGSGCAHCGAKVASHAALRPAAPPAADSAASLSIGA